MCSKSSDVETEMSSGYDAINDTLIVNTETAKERSTQNNSSVFDRPCWDSRMSLIH